ncbi:MAG: hypothetical protein ACYS22_03900 [Planctomycetota bacterium]
MPFALVLCGLLAGCPTTEIIEPPPAIRHTVAHIPGLALSEADDDAIDAFEESVGYLTTRPEVQTVLVGPRSVTNASKEEGAWEIDTVASVASILAGKTYAVLGEPELEGAVPSAELLTTFRDRGLIPKAAAGYSPEALIPGLRLVVLNTQAVGSVSARSRRLLDQVLETAKEPMLMVAMPRIAEGDPELEALVANSRVKLIFVSGHEAEVRKLGEAGPWLVATPDRMVRIATIEGDRVRFELYDPLEGALVSEPRSEPLR